MCIRDRCHTNFKLAAEGEFLVLSDENGTSIDQINFPELLTDQSYGREEDGGNNWVFFNNPTPAFTNNNSTSIDFADPPIFSLQERFHETATQLNLECTTPDCTIHFSVDGSVPTESHPIYNNTITIDTTTTIRAKVFAPQSLPSKIITQTYFIQDKHELPIMAITAEPFDLFDFEEGIMVDGPNADSEWPFFGANFWEDIETVSYTHLTLPTICSV